MGVHFVGADKSAAALGKLAICEATQEALRLDHNARGAAVRLKVESILGVKWSASETLDALLLRVKPEPLKALAATTEYERFRKWQDFDYRSRSDAVFGVRATLFLSLFIPGLDGGRMLPTIPVTPLMLAAVDLARDFEEV